ncbi:hypothetical protein SeMB42_g03242 [Synchytrium endobioticum]|uniref:Uncharacterized protein n=1 Tax=Synchytrium endobioticum TaxID=286115 RepID=A0A507D8J4_9FUNG|nr:hypothetical protein SeLEV6574_g04901 [Synchytrium endobioticum]TPX47675.1 hypothetical protein SeMB42_g03242 [Synchytrium endobioticum]
MTLFSKLSLFIFAYCMAASPIQATNHKSNAVWLKGLPYNNKCTDGAGGAAFQTNFFVRVRGNQPNGDDGVVLTITCAKGGALKMGPGITGCDKPTLSGKAMTCKLTDDLSDYGGILTCPDTKCTDTDVFAVSAVDKDNKKLEVVGNILAPNVENNCTPGQDQVNILQINGDDFCHIEPKTNRAGRALGVMTLVNCKPTKDKFPVITATFNDPDVGIERLFWNVTRPKVTGKGQITWTEAPGTRFSALVSNNPQSCTKIGDAGKGRGYEDSTKTLKITGCKATIGGKDVKCVYGFDSLKFPNSWLEWTGTGPDPYPTTAFKSQ